MFLWGERKKWGGREDEWKGGRKSDRGCMYVEERGNLWFSLGN